MGTPQPVEILQMVEDFGQKRAPAAHLMRFILVCRTKQVRNYWRTNLTPQLNPNVRHVTSNGGPVVTRSGAALYIMDADDYNQFMDTARSFQVLGAWVQWDTPKQRAVMDFLKDHCRVPKPHQTQLGDFKLFVSTCY